MNSSVARANALKDFRKEVWSYWRKSGRHDLAWRKTKDPYRILVSEVMLQQTQVARVKEKYRGFLEMFPNVRTLAKAPLTDVLKVWSGLGYNRRAKFLHDAAIMIVEKHTGRVPRKLDALLSLPGVGDYTAKAVRVFAFNEPEVLIETNVRTVFIHLFFKNKKKVSDTEISTYAKKAAVGQGSREWHWALMDYGAHLKASGVRINARSKHYVRQSKFEGSFRQVRGAILRVLANGQDITALRGPYMNRFDKALASLVRDGLLTHVK